MIKNKTKELFTIYIVQTSFDGKNWFSTPCNPRSEIVQKMDEAHVLTGMMGFIDLDDARKLVSLQCGPNAHHRITKLRVTIHREVIEEHVAS
jgi:hypothetical protein